MSRTGPAALLLAAALVLAGCGALPGDPTPAPTATPEPTATAAPLPERPAPGLTDEGVADAGALARAHVGALANTSHTYVSVTVIEEGGRRLGMERTVRRVGPAGRAHVTVRVIGELPRAFAARYDADVYANARMTVVRLRRGGRQFSVIYPPGEAPVATSSASMERFVRRAFADLEVTRIERVGGGDRARYRIRARGDRLRFAFAEASDVRATAVVDGRGMIWRLRIEYDAARRGWTGRVERTITYRDVGATDVDRPDWVEGAIANATERGS